MLLCIINIKKYKMQGQANLSTKESFVFSQITQKGYPIEKFEIFLIQTDPVAGKDLNLWQMKNLQLAVIKFIQICKQTQIISQQRPTINMVLNQQPLLYFSNKQTFYKTIDCVKIQPTNFFNSKCEISIFGYQKKQGGVFSKSYYIFNMKTVLKNKDNEASIIVFRRYSDFQWLRSMIIAAHPSMPIPPLSGKGKMRLDYEKHVMKRMFLLQKFLSKMIEIPQLKADPLLQSFLLIQNPAQFEKYKKKIKPQKQNIPLNNIKTLSGIVTMLLSQDTQMFNAEAQKYLTITQPQIKQIYKDFKGAATQLQFAVGFMKNISNNCQQLGVNFRQFYRKSNLIQNDENIFSLLELTANNYADFLAQESKIFRKQIYSLMKYQSLYMIGLIQSLGRVREAQQYFTSQKDTLTKKKQKLFQQGNMKKWELIQMPAVKPEKRQDAFAIMLPKQTNIVLKIRQDYALLNYQVYLELIRFFKTNEEYQFKHLQMLFEILLTSNNKKKQMFTKIREKLPKQKIVSFDPQ